MEPRHVDALRRVFEADRTWTSEGREPLQFHLRHSGGMESHIDHPRWDNSWAVPSEHTIDDLDELEFFRVEPHHNKTRSFGLTLKGRTKAAEIVVPAVAVAAAAGDGAETDLEVLGSSGSTQGGEAGDGPSDIFIVHGHSREDEVARAVQQISGREPILLSEQPGRGRTIIEKFEDHAGHARFAVVLLTADDVGAAKEEAGSLNPRARQNAILELGFFLAKVGRGNVAVLYESDVELPSDYTGVEYICFGDEWRWKLRRELNAAGFETS